MTDGHQYGLRIRSVDPFNEVQFGNNGYSEIRTFWFGFNPNEGEEEEPPVNQAADCFQNCHYTANIGTNNAPNPAAFTEWQIGYFTMKEIDITQNNGIFLWMAQLQLKYPASTTKNCRRISQPQSQCFPGVRGFRQNH